MHAIGDLAVDDIAAIFGHAIEVREWHAAEAAAGRAPFRPPDPSAPARRPFRIEHAQHLSSPEAAATLAHDDIIVVPNPLHLLDDALSAGAKLGPERAASPGRAFPMRTLASAGVQIAIASDWPVVGLDPLLAVHAATTRQPRGLKGLARSCDGHGGDAAGSHQSAAQQPCFPWPWIPEESLDSESALMAHTGGAAAALMLEDYVGALREGLRADFVVLDRSPMEVGGDDDTMPPKILATFVDGACAYGCDRSGPWPWAAG